MRLETSVSPTARARLRFAGAVFLLIALIVPALVVALAGCSESEARPVRADLPALLLEAAPSEGEAAPKGSPARSSVRDSLRHVLETEKKCGDEIGKRFRRSELSFYLLMDESYVGGTFPLGTAVLLREVHELETKYLTEHKDFPKRLAENLAQTGVAAEDQPALVDEMAGAFAAQRRPVLAAIEAHQKLVEALAELYELVGSQPKSIRAMRNGLEISDAELLESFNSQIDTVNSAIDTTDLALQALDAEQKLSIHWMGLVKRIPR